MASKALLMAIFIAAAAAPALGVDHMVDWKLGSINYTEWAAENAFHVGDTLMFMYDKEKHNVLSVSGANFKACNASGPLKGPFNSGNDTISLSTTGKKWYICGVTGHCDGGMKFVIDVTVEGPAPAPAPVSAVGEVTPFKSFVWVVAAVTTAFWMTVA